MFCDFNGLQRSETSRGAFRAQKCLLAQPLSKGPALYEVRLAWLQVRLLPGPENQ